MVAIDALPSESTVVDKHSALASELNKFNREALAIMALTEELRPQSEAFAEMGEKLQRVLAAGLENLSQEDLNRFNARLDQMTAWRERFQPRYNALQARVAAQERREADLKAAREATGRGRRFSLTFTPLESLNRRSRCI